MVFILTATVLMFIARHVQIIAINVPQLELRMDTAMNVRQIIL